MRSMVALLALASVLAGQASAQEKRPLNAEDVRLLARVLTKRELAFTIRSRQISFELTKVRRQALARAGVDDSTLDLLAKRRQESRPWPLAPGLLSVGDLMRLSGLVEPAVLLAKIEDYGLKFKPNSASVAVLKGAGLDATVIGQLEELARKPAAWKELNRPFATRETALRLYRAGKGAEAIDVLEDAVTRELVSLRDQIKRVLQLHRASVARDIDDMDSRRGGPYHELIRRIVSDPTNKYHQWAEAAIAKQNELLGALHVEAAKEAFSKSDRRRAAAECRQALKHDPSNEAAKDLRAEIEWLVGVEYSSLYRSWRQSGDARSFLTAANKHYAVLRAASPAHALLRVIRIHIRRAGGKVPSKRD